MRIPRPVNAVLDWMAGHRMLAAAALVAGAAAAYAAIFLTILWAFALGLAVGAVAACFAAWEATSHLRAERDDLLRQTGALNHQITTLRGQLASYTGGALTHRLPAITPEDPT